MAQDQTPEKDQVLIAHNKETGETGAVTGLKKDGTPAMADTKTTNLSDLIVFDIHKNPIEAFLHNFIRQCKNPSMFGFYKIDADTVNSVGPVVQDALKDPEGNKAMLDPQKVEAKPENRKYQKIDADKIDWDTLRERWGIDKELLEKRGDLSEMMKNRKSGLVNINLMVDGEPRTAAARLSFKTDDTGNVKVVPSFVCEKPNLDIEFNGVKFSEQDKENLKNTGNLGRLADVVDKQTGEVVPSFISIDRQTNEILSVPAKNIYVRDTVGQTKLTMAEINTLKSGKAIKDKQITDRNGKQYTVTLQVSADRRDVEFVPDQKKQHRSQEKSEEQGQTQSTWMTKDGRIRPITKWAGVPMSEQQQADYAAGKTVVLSNMVDKEGKPCTVYLTFNKEKQRPNTSLKDPRLAQSVTPANESKTQMSVNNDGKTNEATKHINEPLQKGQTQPKDETQKRKPRGPKV